MKLRSWLVWNGLGGDEVGLEAGGVGIEQLLDAIGASGFEDEAGVMLFRDAVGDFRIGVGGRIGMFLAGERKNDSGVVAAPGRKLIGLVPCSDFEPRPLAPEVDHGGGLYDVRNIGAADAGGDFNEVKFAVGVGAEELGVSHSAHEAKSLQQIAIDFEERFGFFRFTRKSARGEYAALMRGVKRRRAVGVGFGESDAAIGNHAVDVIDGAGKELLEQVKRLLVAELVQPAP